MKAGIVRLSTGYVLKRGKRKAVKIEYLTRRLTGGGVGVRFWDVMKPGEAYDTGAEGEDVNEVTACIVRRAIMAGLAENGEAFAIKRALGPGRQGKWMGDGH